MSNETEKEPTPLLKREPGAISPLDKDSGARKEKAEMPRVIVNKDERKQYKQLEDEGY